MSKQQIKQQQAFLQWSLVPLIALIGQLLSGCAHQTPPVAVTVRSDVSCRAFSRLTWSIDDTTNSINGIRRHNARYVRICGPNRKPK